MPTFDLDRARKLRFPSLIARLGTPGHADPHVVAAHAILKHLEPHECPPLSAIRVADLPPDLEATCIKGVIFISSRYASDDPMRLAMLLHHEHFHARHPAASEFEALGASMRFAADWCGPDVLQMLGDKIAEEHTRVR